MDYFPPLNGNLADPNRPHINANLGTGVQGSIPDAAGYQAMMISLLNVIDGAGLARNGADLTLLRQAIQTMIAQGAHAVVISDAVFAGAVADGDVVRWDAGNARFDRATADGTANNRAVGVADVGEEKVYCFGELPAGLVAGLTPGGRYYLHAASAGDLTATRPSDAVVIGIAKAADVLFVDIDAASVSGVGKHTIPVRAADMDPNITNGCGYYSRVDIGTNQPECRYLPFDPTVEESAELQIPIPKCWNGGAISARAIWSHAAAATYGVAWGFKAAFLRNDDAKALNFGAEVIVTDAGGTTNDTYVSDETAAITPSGTAADHGMLSVRVSRKVADAGDTLNVDARLEGIELLFTTDSPTDD